MAVYNGIDTESRERVYSGDPGQYEGDREFGREVGRSAIYQKYADEFERDPERDYPLILEKARELNHDPEHITVSMFLHSLETLVLRAPAADRWRPGYLKRKPAPAPVEEEAPVEVDRNGRPLSSSQLAWREHAEWSRTATSAQIAERKRTDKSYHRFVENSLRLEMAQPTDGVMPAGSPLVSKPDVSVAELERLKDFAAKYRLMSTYEIKTKQTRAINPSADAFVADVNLCSDLGLL